MRQSFDEVSKKSLLLQEQNQRLERDKKYLEMILEKVAVILIISLEDLGYLIKGRSISCNLSSSNEPSKTDPEIEKPKPAFDFLLAQIQNS